MAGARALVLVTKAAAEANYEECAAELEQAGIQAVRVDIPEGRNETEIFQIFDALTQRVEDGDRVTVDVTFSLRHLPFILVAALIYMVGLKKVQVDGIYYGAFLLKDEHNTVPILDITALFRMIEWYHALAAANQEGDFRALGKLLKGDVGRLFQSGQRDMILSKASGLVAEMASSLASVLPLETGLQAAETMRVIEELEMTLDPALAARLALDRMKSWLAKWAVDALDFPYPKDGVRLSNKELERQLDLACWYADLGNLPAALLVLREWMVSFQQLQDGLSEDWLGRERRAKYEKRLSELANNAKRNLVTGYDREIASLWDRISGLRNRFAHAGMTPEKVKVSSDKISFLLQKCRNMLTMSSGKVPDLFDDRSTNGSWLITPLGLSKGLLYSAMQTVRPDNLAVLATAASRGAIGEVLGLVGFTATPFVMEMADAHMGFDEAKRLVKENAALWENLAAASCVTVNITGGTTAMQYVVGKLASEAARLGVPVRMVAMVDRRPYAEQQANPFVCGEMIDLGKGESTAF